MHAGGYVEASLQSGRKHSEVVGAADQLLQELNRQMARGKFKPSQETKFLMEKLDRAINKL